MSRQITFEVIPVIHISSGRVIRWEGDHFVRCHGIESNPLSLALHWVGQGATQIHVVDLDAVNNRVSAVPALMLALKNFPVRMSLAGGIHSLGVAKERLSYGISPLVVGSLLDSPAIREKVVSSLGTQNVWGSIDVTRGRLPWARLHNAINAGLNTLVLTARSPDILATGDILRFIEDRTRDGISIWASGQIREYQDLLTMARAGCRGALLSRALHEGALTIDGVVRTISRDTGPKTA